MKTLNQALQENLKEFLKECSTISNEEHQDLIAALRELEFQQKELEKGKNKSRQNKTDE